MTSDINPSLPKQDVITEVVRRINDKNFKKILVRRKKMFAALKSH